MQKINGKVLYSEFKTNDSCQRRDSMPENISGDLIEFHNSGIKINIDKRGESLT